MASATLVQDCPTGNTCPVPFTFKDHQIRTVAIDDQPWFVARDVSKALGIAWSGRTLDSIPDHWKGMMELITPRGKQRMATVAEPAVYKLAFRSNKPEADAFTNWVASEVLPAIRKTGQFSAPVPIGPLTPAQCRHLHDVLDAKVGTLPKEAHRAAYAEAWTRFNRHFRIAKYAQLPQEQFSDALAYLIGMKIVAGSLGPVAQKALPAAPAQNPAIVELPEGDLRDDLIREIQRHGGNAHDAVTRLWELVWRDVNSWRWEHDKPAAFAQLRHMSDAVFDSLSDNIEAVRRMARTIDVTYREMRALSRKGA